MRITTDRARVRSLTKEYWRQGREVLYKTSLPVIDLLDKIPLQEIRHRTDSLLKAEHTEKYILDLWTKTGGKFAVDMVKMIRRLKSIDDPELGMWEDAFRLYMYERSQKIAKKILSTEAELINSLIDKVVTEGYETGQSIGVISQNMKDDFMRRLVKLQTYEAERIARTEVIGASNKGSYDGALSTGANIQKGWSTSGLPGIRQAHLLYESFGWVSMDKEFAPGLKYPGDPAGPADEIINCRCTIIYNVDI